MGYPTREEILKEQARKRAKYWLLFFGLIGMVIAFGTLMNSAGGGYQASPPAMNRGQLIEKQFSPWDGSHISLERYIKDNMNDPASYEHISTRYWESGDTLIVVTEFRGNNAFGGKVKDAVQAEVDLNGNIVKVFNE